MLRHRFQNKKYLLIKILGASMLWLVWIGVVWLISPDELLGIVLFFGSLFGSIWLTGMIVTNSLRRCFLVSLLAVGVLLMRFYGLDELVNVALLVGLLATIELFFVVK